MALDPIWIPVAAPLPVGATCTMCLRLQKRIEILSALVSGGLRGLLKKLRRYKVLASTVVKL